MRKTKISTNMLLNVCKTLLNIVFPIITFPYISRVLGVEALGKYQFSTSYINYFLMLAGLGISTYGIREAAKYRNNQNEMEIFVSEVFTINIVSALVAYIALILIAQIAVLKNYREIIYILSIEIAFTTIGVAWLCNVFEDFFYITVRHFIIHILLLVCTLSLVKNESDVYMYAFLVTLANSGSGLINFFYIRKHYCKFRLAFNGNLKKHLKPILIIFSTTIAVTIYVSSDTTMLGLMVDDYEVGLYSAAVKIYTIIKTLLAAILVVLIPRFSSLYAAEDDQKANALLKKVIDIMVPVILPASVGLACLSKEIIAFVSGVSFSEGSLALTILSGAIFFSLFASMLVNCVLIPRKQEKIVFFATAVSAVVNIALNFILIPLGRRNATAFTTFISEIITFVIVFNEAKKVAEISYEKKDLFISCLGSFLIVIICVFGRQIVGGAYRLIVLVPLSVFSYGIIIMMSDTQLSQEIKKRLPH